MLKTTRLLTTALLLAGFLGGLKPQTAQAQTGQAQLAAPLAPPFAATFAAPAKALSETENRVEFAKTDAARVTFDSGSRERGETAKKAADLAAAIAWAAFEAGRFEEAAQWFSQSGDLNFESYQSATAYYEANRKQVEIQFLGMLTTMREQLAAATLEAEKTRLRASIDIMVSTLHSSRSIAAMGLINLALAANDDAAYLKYQQQKLALEREHLLFLTAKKAPASQLDDQRAQIATALEGVGAGQSGLTFYDLAEKSYLEALALRKTIAVTSPKRALYEPLSDLGLLFYHEIGDLPKARGYYEQALAAFEADARSLGNQPQTAKDTGFADLALAQTSLKRAMILNNLGDITLSAGDLRVAGDFYKRALQLGKNLPPGPGLMGMVEMARTSIQARTLGSLAYLDAQSGRLDSALTQAKAVIELNRKLGADRGLANALALAANFYFEKGDFAAAIPYVKQARALYSAARHKDGVVAMTGYLAELANQSENLDEAARYSVEELILARGGGNLGSVSNAALGLAEVRLKQGRLPEVEPLLQESQMAATRTGNVRDQIGLLRLRGQLLEAQNQPAAALASYQKAVALLESIRETATSAEEFGSRRSNYKPYELIVHLLVKMNRATEAFDYLGRAKSKELQDSLRLTNIKAPNAGIQLLLDQAGNLETRLRTLRSTLQTQRDLPPARQDAAAIRNLEGVVASTQQQFYEVSDRLQEANPDNKDLFTITPATLGGNQDSIPEGTVLVQYVPLGQGIYIFLATKTDLKAYLSPVKPAELWNLVRAVRSEISAPDEGKSPGAGQSRNAGQNRNAVQNRGAARAMRGEGEAPPLAGSLNDHLSALYALLIAPIEGELKGKDTLAFIPNGELYYLPIHALAKKNPDGTLHYLIEDRQVVYLAEADAMKALLPRRTGAVGTGIAAFGNPTGAALPASLKEVVAIGQIFPGSQILSGAQVTKEAVLGSKSLDRRVLHFATHGVLDANVPRNSYIQLAQSDAPGASQLTVGEIYGQDMRKVDLVTLSACQTALSPGAPGREILTLASAFSRAKVRSVVASLWSVSDASTEVLMVEFYRQLLAGQSKGAALRAAQLKVMKNPQYKHPFYWAPFILMGDWR